MKSITRFPALWLRRTLPTLLALVFVGLAAPSLNAQAFNHPGVRHSLVDLDLMKSRILANQAPWKGAYNNMLAWGGINQPGRNPSSLSFTPDPVSTIDVGYSENPATGVWEGLTDSTAAYIHAIQWYVTGNAAHAEKVIQICNAWGTTLTSIQGDNAKLNGSMIGLFFCDAAEIVKSTYTGAAPGAWTAFDNMLRNKFYPLIQNFEPGNNGNWDATITSCMMGIGIVLNDRPIYNRARDYFLSGSGNGSLPNYVRTDGTTQETTRDQRHEQMGVLGLTNVAEMAWKQGEDLYSALNNRLLIGLEGTAGRVDSQNFKAYPGWDIAYNHYKNRKGLSTPMMDAFKATSDWGGDNWSYNTVGLWTIMTFRDLGDPSGTPGTPTVWTPTFSPASGTYAGAQSVSLSTSTSGATIRFTLDGSTPNETTGTIYSAPIAVSATTTIKAIGYKTGETTSSVATSIYTIVPPGTVVANTGGSFVNTSMTAQTGTFTATFNASPSASPNSAVVGLSNGSQTAFTGLATAVRFNTSGNIDARNGGAYAAASVIPFSANTTYSFRLVVNVTAHTYSIYVTPAGGSELTVGTNYAFRTEQNTVTSLNNWAVVVDVPGNGGAGTLLAWNFSLGATPPSADSLTYAEGGPSVDEPDSGGRPKFYVDAVSGNDSAAGTRAAPWQTAGKVASHAQTAAAGTHYLFKRGVTFTGNLNLFSVAGASGAGNRLVFGAYDSGSRPRLSGTISLSGTLSAKSRYLMIRDLDVGDTFQIRYTEQVTIFNNEVSVVGSDNGIVCWEYTDYIAIVSNFVWGMKTNDGIVIHPKNWVTPVQEVGNHFWILDNDVIGNSSTEDLIDIATETTREDFKVVANRLQCTALSGYGTGGCEMGIQLGHDGVYYWVVGNTINGGATNNGIRIGTYQGANSQAHLQVSGNVVFNSFKHNVQINSEDVIFNHNTLLRSANNRAAINFLVDAANVALANNLVVVPAGIADFTFDSVSAGAAITSSNSNWFGNDSNALLEGKTLPVWRSTYGFDLASSTGDTPGVAIPNSTWDDPRTWKQSAFLDHFIPDTSWTGNSGANTPGAFDSVGNRLGYSIQAFPGYGLGWPGPDLVQSKLIDLGIIYGGGTPTVANPTFNPVGGTYSSPQSVTLNSTTSGATIRFTLDGSTPNETVGTVYTAPITVSTTTTIKTVGYKTGETTSAVASATYTFIAPGTVVVSAGAGWTNTAMPAQTGTFTATFQATPSASPTNALIGLSSGSRTTFSGFACAVRFNTTGKIDARNGSAYPASTIPFASNKTYTFRLVVNVPARSYSVYVTPAGGSELTVGSNYAFRTEQAAVTTLNNWGAVVDAAANGGAGTLTVANFAIGGSVAPAITTPPASQSVVLGAPVTFTVVATGMPTPTLQWYKDNVLLGGQTATTLNIASAQLSHAGAYTVTATNAAGSATSAPAATLSVSEPYATWAAANGLTAANNTSTADPDGDGVANQLEQFLGLSPLSPDANGQPTGTVESNRFVLRFTRAKLAAAAFVAETSTDLFGWSPLAVSLESSTASTETLVASIPLTAPKQFLRLNVAGITTVPLGYLKATLPTGVTTAFGLPLDGLGATPIGLRAAKIEALTATTITQSLGGWTGNLANPAAPWALRLTSGVAVGKLLDLAANTTTSLTVAGADLIALGIAPDDTFELVPLDTLGTLFGGATFQGGTSSANADVVQVRSGTAWLAFYYDNTLGFWRRTSGVASNANNVVLRPGAALLVLRRGASLTLTWVGRVLGTAYRTPVNNAGTTGLTTGFPTNTTLGGLALQTLLPGWRAGISTATADAVGLYSGTGWIPYIYNGTYWQTAAGVNADTVSLPAGTVLLLQRPGATAGTTDLTYNKPY